MLEKLRTEEKSGCMYRSEDTSSCVMFIIPKMNDPSKPRYIYWLVKRHEGSELQFALIPSQSLIRNAVATHLFKTKLDISDSSQTMRVHLPYKKYTPFSTAY